jgi:hypothetical protein
MSEQSHERDVLRQPSAAEQQKKEAAEQQRKLEEEKQRGDKTEENK